MLTSSLSSFRARNMMGGAGPGAPSGAPGDNNNNNNNSNSQP